MMSFFTHFGSGNTTPGSHWLWGIGAATVAGIVAEQALLFRGLRRGLLSVYSKRQWWDYLTTYKGLICEDVQKEVQYTTILSVHHAIGGYLMVHGIRHQKPEFWAAGAIVELADDIHDSALMILQKWPFGGGGKTDVKLTSLMLTHHMAGIVCIVPTLVHGLHSHPRVQKIGGALLSAGAVSLAVLTGSRTCNRKDAAQARVDAALWVTNLGFYMYCRLYVFPRELLGIFREDYNNFTPFMQKALVVFTVAMSAFNLAIWVDGSQQTIQRVKSAWKLTMHSA